MFDRSEKRNRREDKRDFEVEDKQEQKLCNEINESSY